MGKTKTGRSHTLPSSPTHSSSSSDFEFMVSLSPRKSSPADDLFYKGQLLPLHLSSRISMVRTLLLSSSSSSSSATTARHSSDSHSSFSTDGCDSTRPSSVADDDLIQTTLFPGSNPNTNFSNKKTNKYFSLSRFSSVFRKDTRTTTVSKTAREDPYPDGSSVKRMSITAKEVIRKYLNKAKPLYQKLSSNNNNNKTTVSKSEGVRKGNDNNVISQSFSGNLRYPRRRSCISSCPSSMRSSPSHSGILCRNSVLRGSNSSSMEELQNAIQGAIAHCKNSMNK